LHLNHVSNNIIILVDCFILKAILFLVTANSSSVSGNSVVINLLLSHSVNRVDLPYTHIGVTVHSSHFEKNQKTKPEPKPETKTIVKLFC